MPDRDPLQQIRELIDSLPRRRNRLVAVILAEDVYDRVHAHCKTIESYKCEPGPEFQIIGIDIRKERYLKPGHYMPVYQRTDGTETWDQDDTRTFADRMAQARYERSRHAPPNPNAGEYLRETARRLEEIGRAPEIHPTDFSVVEQIRKETEE